MKTNLFNPSQTSPHLNELISLLVQQFKPLQIYQFAQWKRQESCHSVFAGAMQEEQTIDYLLVITADGTSTANEIQDFVDNHFTASKLMIYAHEQEVVQQNLAASNGYFSAVLKNASLCYAKEGLSFNEEIREPNPKRWLGKAIINWRKRNHMAKGFSEAAEHALECGHERICLYLLHQAIEQACVGLIWVFMAYKIDHRNIERLLYTCGCFSQAPLQHFIGTLENQKLLELMMKSYRRIGHEDDFSLGGKSIYRFVELVQSFLELADSLCKERFQLLESSLPEKEVGLVEGVL